MSNLVTSCAKSESSRAYLPLLTATELKSLFDLLEYFPKDRRHSGNGQIWEIYL